MENTLNSTSDEEQDTFYGISYEEIKKQEEIQEYEEYVKNILMAAYQTKK